MHSPEVQSSQLAALLSNFPKDVDLHPFAVIAAKAVLELHMPHQPLLFWWVRSSIASHLIVSLLDKLSPTVQAPPGLLWCGWSPPWGPRLVNLMPLLSIYGGLHPLGHLGQVACSKSPTIMSPVPTLSLTLIHKFSQFLIHPNIANTDNNKKLHKTWTVAQCGYSTSITLSHYWCFRKVNTSQYSIQVNNFMVHRKHFTEGIEISLLGCNEIYHWCCWRSKCRGGNGKNIVQ